MLSCHFTECTLLRRCKNESRRFQYRCFDPRKNCEHDKVCSFTLNKIKLSLVRQLKMSKQRDSINFHLKVKLNVYYLKTLFCAKKRALKGC